MRIELDDLECCCKCGCIFDYTKGIKTHQSDYERSAIFMMNCPACKEEHKIFE